MKQKKQKTNTIFNSIRKPLAPPTKRFGNGSRPDAKIHPTGRKAKHKPKTDDF